MGVAIGHRNMWLEKGGLADLSLGFKGLSDKPQAHQCLCTSELHGIPSSSVSGATVLEGQIVTAWRYGEAGQLLWACRGQKDAKRESYVIGVMKDVKSTKRI